jgi:hypothetical protein
MYQQCAKLYLNRYRDKQDGANVWASVGTAVHTAIEMYYRESVPIHRTFMEQLEKINPNIKGYDYLPNLQQAMTHGLIQFNPDKYAVLEIDGKKQLERHFRLKYPNDDNPVCTLEGYIDHITPDGFIDYKTSNDSVSKKSLKNDLQFAVYFWAYERLYGKYPSYGIYYRIRDNKEIVITDVADVLDSAVSTMLADPMIYDDTPCDTCPMWCGLRKKDANHT